MTIISSSELYQPDEYTFLCGYRRVRRYGTTQSEAYPAIPTSYSVYQVKPDDTLERIALKYNCSVSSIARVNKLWSSNALFMKESIKIPIYNSKNSNSSEECRTPIEEKRQYSKQCSSTKSSSNGQIRVSSSNSESSMHDILQRIDKNIQNFQKYEISNKSVLYDETYN